MASFDVMAAAIDWLDAYRAKDLNRLLSLYSRDAAIECSCDGKTTVMGNAAISKYWQQRFEKLPASELFNLDVDGKAILVSFGTANGPVRAMLYFNDVGLIEACHCGQDARRA